MAKTVMVVDDQPGIRLLFKEIVTQDGYLYKSAENGREALNIIEFEKPDLLIVDYNLPIMNGSQLLQFLEDKGINVPTILMSGLPEKLEEDRARFEMVRKVLAKPFDIVNIRQDIHDLLN